MEHLWIRIQRRVDEAYRAFVYCNALLVDTVEDRSEDGCRGRCAAYYEGGTGIAKKGIISMLSIHKGLERFALDDHVVADGGYVWIPSTGAIVDAAIRDIVRGIIHLGGVVVGIRWVRGGEIGFDGVALVGSACILGISQ